MENKKDKRKKLEQQMLFLMKNICRIQQRLEEHMLRGILLNAKKDALEFKHEALKNLINQNKGGFAFPKQVIEARRNSLSLKIVLFLN